MEVAAAAAGWNLDTTVRMYFVFVMYISVHCDVVH